MDSVFTAGRPPPSRPPIDSIPPSRSAAKKQGRFIAVPLAFGTERQAFGKVVFVERFSDEPAAETEHAQRANGMANPSL